MRGLLVLDRSAARACKEGVVVLNCWKLLTTRSTTNEDISGAQLGSDLTTLTKTHEKLEFAIEGANQISASANLSFLERDPTQRGPRAQFERDVAVLIRDDISAALRDAKREITARGGEKRALESKEVSMRLESLMSLMRPAEEAVDEMSRKIAQADERLGELERGGVDD